MARPQNLKTAMPGLIKTFRHLYPYTKKQWKLVAGSFVALFAAVGFRALEPWPLQLVIDHVIMPREGTSFLENGPSFTADWFEEPANLLIAAALALIITISGRAYAAYSHKVGFALVGNRVLTEVRGALYRHLQCLSLSFHNRARGGDLVIRVISDIGMLKDMAVTALMPLLASVMMLLVMAGLMLWMNWQLALIVLGTLPLYWLPTIRISKKIQRVSRDQRKREGAMASTAAEAIGAIQVVQALSLENTFNKQFAGQNQKSLKEGVKAKRLAVRLESTVQVMIGISTALVLWFGTQQVLNNALSAGELLVFLSYLKAMFKPMQDFAKYTGRIAKASAAGQRVVELFEEQPDITNLPDAQHAKPFAGHVSFRAVSFGYTPDNQTLKEISLDINAGKTVALVGPSGNGKSTLVGLLPRLYDVDAGGIEIDGMDIRDMTLASLRTQISMVLQNNLLFAASVKDNIAYGASGVTDHMIEAAARLANAHEFILDLPDGYNTVLAERGASLSAGQRQRIAIARAAVRNAPILILDEPATGLDEENAKAIRIALKRLAKGRTTFLVTHDLQHAASADVIYYVEDGQIAESGAHTELLSQEGRYAALYQMQQVEKKTEPVGQTEPDGYTIEEVL